jgi:hypothetical protein
MLRKFGIIAVLSLLLVAVTAAVASAQNVHLKGGANAEPSFRDNGLTLTAAGELAGLGNGDVLVTLDATANPTATCTNPAGATQPPGQNPAEVDVTGSVAIPEDEIKNGNTPFSVIPALRTARTRSGRRRSPTWPSRAPRSRSSNRQALSYSRSTARSARPPPMAQ